jgi:hypothetical protein
VESKQAEEVHQNFKRLFVNPAFLLDLLKRGEIGLDDHPLRVCLGEAVEVDEEIVPCFLLLIAVLAGLERQERDAPCECSDEILVGPNDIKSTANVAAILEVCENARGVVGGLVAVENRTGRFEKLRIC